MDLNRIRLESLRDKVITAEDAALLFEDGMVVGSSGFTKAGDSKAVLPALAERAKRDPLKITLMTGASLGHGTDGKLAEAGALSKRMPFQVDRTLRNKINEGEVLFIDQHLSESAELLHNKNLPDLNW
jgi:acetyl-CoA hydrolase/succinyl-CoA:acetate CoA-transferase